MPVVRPVGCLICLLVVMGCVEAPPTKEPDEISVSCEYIDRCLARLKAEPEAELLGDRAASVVTSAERTLPVFWGADPASLSAPLRARIDAYPTQIRGWVDRINELKSAQAVKSMQALAQEHNEWRKANQDKLWQDFINRDEDVIRKMQTLAAGMSAGPSLTEASKILLAHQKLMNQHARSQLTDYQKRAIRHSHGFVSFVLTNTITRDSVLIAAFEENQVAKIDAGLLDANTRRLYDTAIGFMDNKLKERTRSDFLLKLIETEKWPLSDF